MIAQKMSLSPFVGNLGANTRRVLFGCLAVAGLALIFFHVNSLLAIQVDDNFVFCDLSFPTHPECWNGGCRMPEDALNCTLIRCKRKNGQYFDHDCRVSPTAK